MSSKLIYKFSLVGFFLVWGVFGFKTGIPHNQTVLQATVPVGAMTVVAPQATASAGIPVTGDPEPLLAEIFVFYGLIGLTASFLILALLNIAHRSTVAYVERKRPSSEETPKH